MIEKLIVDVQEVSNSVTISVVDENGNGEILVQGKMGGCAFLNEAEQMRRIEVLGRLALPGTEDNICTGLIDIEIARLEKEMKGYEDAPAPKDLLKPYMQARVKCERLKAVREVYP